MNSYPLTIDGNTIPNFLAVFEAMPGSAALLQLDSPHYTVLAVSQEYCQNTRQSKTELIGRGFFEPFPASSLHEDFTGEKNIRDSLQKVLETKQPDHLPAQRYDMPIGDGKFTEKYWAATNKPVLDEGGNVIYIIHTSVDITASVKAEHQAETIKGLKAVENLLMQVPAAIHIFKGEDLRVAVANEQTLNQWNRGPEVVGKPMVEVLPETAGQGFVELLRSVMRSGESKEFYEHPVVLRRFGKEETGYFSFSYRPFYEEGDDVATGVLVVGTEVTDKVEAKKELAEKEQRLEMAVKIANLGDYKVDVLTDTATYSQQVMEWFGLKGQKESMTEIFSKVHPDDTKFVASTIQRSLVSEAKSYHDITYRLINAQGVPLHIRSIGKTQFENGKAVAIYGILQDVTEQVLVKEAIEQTVAERTEELRKAHASLAEANAYLQTVINLFQEPLQVLEPVLEGGDVVDFRFKLTNAAYAAYANAKPQDLYGKRVSELFPGYLSTSSFTKVAETYRTAKADTWEIHYNKDGLDLYNIMSATRMDSDVIVHFTDVSPLKHLQLELERKVAELERSNRQLEDFTHAASHDLKEPIRKIQVFTSQLKDRLKDQLKEHEAKLLNRVEDASYRMGILVEDLLTYSHVSQKPQLKDEIDLNEKVKRVLEDLELDIQEKGATVQVEKLPVVNGNRRQLQQLFQNLISNAIKYGRQDQLPQILITSKQIYRDDKLYFGISVKDNGIGFEQEYAEKIFGMFTRLHGKAEYSGTGVGLAIVKKVVENHNGFLEVASTTGEGSTFTFYLPVQ